MILIVRLEITAGVKRSQLQYRLCTTQAPTCPGNVQPVVDQVTTGSLYDTAGDGETGRQSDIILSACFVFDEIFRALLHAIPFCQRLFCCADPQPFRHLRALAL